MSNVKIDGLVGAIMDALEEYSEEVEEKIDNGIDEISDALVNQLENDPVIPERTGEYKKSFYAKTVAKGKGFKRNVVANKKYQLTHLLEYPHATRGGKGRSKAYPHWQTAQDKLDEFTEELKNKL